MTSPRKDGNRRKPSDLLHANLALLPFLAVLVLIIVFRYFLHPGPMTVALLWAGACLISGCLVGFLFGIPRVVQIDVDSGGTAKAEFKQTKQTNSARDDAQNRIQRAAGYRQLVNTNLVEISDWLTKIIVGLGLVNLGKVPGLVDSAASVLASELPEKGYAFATSLIVAFSVLGFLMGYLYTRLFLAGAFYRAEAEPKPEEDLREFVEVNVPDDGSREVTDAQVQAARRVFASPQAKDLQSTVAVLKSLASEYDRVRREMIASDERTAHMEALVARMRTLALAGYDELAQFANSASPGERLVAVAMLQVKPDPAYLEWLVERILKERPFIVYHALEALRRAAETLPAADRSRIKELLEQKVLATKKGQELSASDTDRGALLNRVMKMVSSSP
jgi:hypothetical protein